MNEKKIIFSLTGKVKFFFFENLEDKSMKNNSSWGSKILLNNNNSGFRISLKSFKVEFDSNHTSAK